MLICDFCSDHNPTWTFRANGSSTLITSGNRTTIIGDVGDGWASCDTCAELIRADKRNELLERAIERFHPANPDFSHVPLDVIRPIVVQQHEGFWKTKLDDGVREMSRTEFGQKRTTCACNTCVTNCKYMPGMLIPSDLERMISGVSDVQRWALSNLLASPGALVRHGATGQVFRIPTLVPAVKPDGSCIHLTPEDRCDIHQIAPFGCAFFDCKSDPSPSNSLSVSGMQAIMAAHANGDLYAQLWKYLWENDKRQYPADVLRHLMQQEAS